MTIGCGKALGDLEEKLGDLRPGAGAGAHCTVPLPPAALRQLERGPGLENALMPDSVLPRARSILGLGGGSYATRAPTPCWASSRSRGA